MAVKNRLSLSALLAVVSAALILIVIKFPSNIISWDVFGYYLYLPQLFIYNDLGINDIENLNNIVATYHNTATLYQIWQTETGDWLIRYTSGQAVMFAPAFFVSHAVALATDFPADGFSLPYQIGLLAGCFIYFAVAFALLRLILLHFFNDKITAVTMSVVFLGTNLFANTLFNIAGVHSQLFFLYAIIVLFTIRWHEKQTWKNILPIAVAAGLIIITRPTDVICLLIPFLWNVTGKMGWKNKAALLQKNFPQLVVSAIIVCAIGSLQMVYWKIYSGHLLIDSYNNPAEGLDFFYPHIFGVLFSFRKGWFVYTPLMVVAFAGFIFVWKEKRNSFYALFIFMLIDIYLVSCWSCWWYAVSFSQRAFVPAYIVMAVPLGFVIRFFDEKPMKFRLPFFLLVSLLIVLNLFQTWQYEKQIIDGSRMTKAAWAANFFKTDAGSCDDRLLLIKRDFSGIDAMDSARNYKERLVLAENYGENGIVTDSETNFTPAIKIPYKKITLSDHAWLRIVCEVMPIDSAAIGGGQLVVTFYHNGNYKYRTYQLPETIPAGEWSEFEVSYLTPEVRTPNDPLCVYYWNQTGKPLAVRRIEVWASEVVK